MVVTMPLLESPDFASAALTRKDGLRTPPSEGYVGRRCMPVAQGSVDSSGRQLS